MNCDKFRKWLQEKNTYTDASIKDIISRLRRANNILIFQNEDIYLFRLEQCEEFQQRICRCTGFHRKLSE